MKHIHKHKLLLVIGVVMAVYALYAVFFTFTINTLVSGELFLLLIAGAFAFVFYVVVRQPTMARKWILVSVGVLALVGSFVFVFSVDYALNSHFRENVALFSLTHLPHEDNPFINNTTYGASNTYLGTTLYTYQGKRVLWPGNKDEKFVTIYGQGNVYYGTLTNGVIVQGTEAVNSVTRTSLWWLFFGDSMSISG